MLNDIDYNSFLEIELKGVYGDYLEKVLKINRWYSIYKGEQEWKTAQGLDYEPTKKITNKIKKLIDTRARFMFGRKPFFDIRPITPDTKGNTTEQDKAQAKEDLLKNILEKNNFHSKLLKARKDCSIGGKIAIKLWAHKEQGLKIIFSTAQEFFPFYDLDDFDTLNKIVFLYQVNLEVDRSKQRIIKQVWEMQGNKCILNEGLYDGYANLIEEYYTDHDTGIDFIPVVIIVNGGLTGETEGDSDVEQLWQNQDAYNRLNSDDIDALKFQMFGQDVITDGSEESIKGIKISPGALVDLQTDIEQSEAGRQAKIERLESHFSYKDKFEDTINRIKNDMYDDMNVPNIGLEQLRGLMQSGKSMKALYWDLMSACEEDWTEWRPALTKLVEYIFEMVKVYNLYNSRQIVEYETTLNIVNFYPIQEDEDDQKRVDIEEVIAEVRSRKSYMNKWGEYEDLDSELEQIQLEKQMLQDSFTQSLNENIGDDE